MRTPELASQARTSVAAARVGLLTTYARHPAGQTTTSVTVEARADGTLDIQLGRHAAGTGQLLARPVATLELHPSGCEPVLLHGAVHRLPGTGVNGALLFHLDVAAVRVGTPAVLLDQREYAAARPDPLAAQAAGVLEHLNSAHCDALTACLRAVGHRVVFAHATDLDTGGLTVAAVSPAGVNTVRLHFPRPINDLAQLPASLALVLNPRCGCAGPSTAPTKDSRASDR